MPYASSNIVKIFLAIIFSLAFFSCSSDYICVKVKKSDLIPDAYEINRDSLIIGGIKIYEMAQRYYYKPALLGGSRSFIGFSIPPHLMKSKYGEYVLSSIKPKTITLTGIGKLTGFDETNPMEVKFYIEAKTISTIIVN